MREEWSDDDIQEYCEECNEMITGVGYDLEGIFVCEDCIDDYVQEYLENTRFDNSSAWEDMQRRYRITRRNEP